MVCRQDLYNVIKNRAASCTAATQAVCEIVCEEAALRLEMVHHSF